MTSLTALLAVDRRFYKVGDRVYTEGPIGAETGGRYLSWFDKVIVAGRLIECNEVPRPGLSCVSLPGLEFASMPDIGGILHRTRSIANVRSKLSELIRSVDCVIARLPSELGIEASLLALNANIPLAIDVAGCVLDGMRAYGSWTASAYAPIAFHRMRYVVARAQWVSFVTQKFLQDRYPVSRTARVVACSNVEISEPSLAVLERRINSINCPPQIPLTFGTIGSLYGNFKGVQHALAALSVASDRLPPYRYRVVGGGDVRPWNARAQSLGIADKVSFEGVLQAGEPVFKWLDEIDIYLQPSLREGLPRALIEAMSRGCPALASNIAGIPELLPPEALHKPGDISRLSEMIVGAVSKNCRINSARSNWARSGAYSTYKLSRVRDTFWRSLRDSLHRC